MQDRERADRTPDQILRSVIGYCQWRAGECWRNVSTSRFRYDQERWDYLDAVRIVHRVRYACPAALAIVAARGGAQLPDHGRGAAPPAAVPAPELRRYAAWSRGQLVAELVRIDPTYTDRKLLSRLSIHKLARMLADAVAAQRRFA
jgi:hypothetical protein